jgi:hypothetical protein
MFEGFRKSLSRGRAIIGVCWSVLKSEPKLMILPIASGVLLLGIIAISVVSFALIAHNDAEVQKLVSSPWSYVVLFAIYVGCYTIIIYLNAALVFCALRCFEGKRTSLTEGLTAAFGRLPQIFAWAVFAGTIGLILKALSAMADGMSKSDDTRAAILGFILSVLVGIFLQASWALLTYFIVPVLVVEGLGPIAAARKSYDLVSTTWGEAVVGELGLGLIGFILVLPVFAFVGLMFLSDALIAPLMGVITIYVVGLVIVFWTLGMVFRAGVYLYASKGVVPTYFPPELTEATFRQKPIQKSK